MVSVYDEVDKALLPTEYLPDDYKGPSASKIQDIVGKQAKLKIAALERNDIHHANTCVRLDVPQ